MDERSFDTIPCCAGNGGDDGALLSEKGVEQRGFTGIWRAKQGNSGT